MLDSDSHRHRRGTVRHVSNNNSFPKPTVLFPTIPIEVRELIYHFVINSDGLWQRFRHIDFSATDGIYGHDPRHAYWTPQLCYVNEATQLKSVCS